MYQIKHILEQKNLTRTYMDFLISSSQAMSDLE